MYTRSIRFIFALIVTMTADCRAMENPADVAEQLTVEIACISSLLAQNKKTFSDSDVKNFEQNIASNKEAIDQLHASGNTDLKKNITNALTTISWLNAQRFVITDRHVSWRQEQLNKLQGVTTNNDRLTQLTSILTAKSQQ